MSSPSRTSSRSSARAATSRLEVIGRGGQGTLWIAYRVRDKGRDGSPELSLKALQSAPNRHPRLPGALLSSLSRWQSATHPAVAAPLEVGTEDGTFYYTAPLLSGPSLEARLSKGALSPEVALRLLRGLAQPLAYLHENGFAHGDLRPRQLLFDDFEALHITDGGIAEAFSASGLSQIDVQPEAAYYLAPERAPNAPPSPAADMYALGVIFYRMLTGRVPFDGASVVSIAAKHRTETAPLPSEINPRVPDTLDALCARLLDKNPNARPRAVQLAEKRAAAPTSPVTPSPTPIAGGVAKTAPVSGAAPVAAKKGATTQPQPSVQSADPPTPVSLKVARKQHRRREFWGFFGAFLWLLALLGAGGGAGYAAYHYWVVEIPPQVKVPDYIGLSQGEAKKLLAKKGLYLRVTRESYNPSKPEGTVLSGEPEPGRTVRARREVTVTVSAGRAPIKMVDFSKLTIAQARKIILQYGLRLGSVVEQYHDTIPAQFICGQFPEPGDALRRSDPITLIVSRGLQPTEIDGTIGDVPVEAPPLASSPEDQTTPNSQTDLAPLENAGGSPNGNPALAPQNETIDAAIRVEVPPGGAQNVRILVRDANGERTVYQEVKSGGSRIRQRVSATRPRGETALVRVYVDEVLIKEEEL